MIGEFWQRLHEANCIRMLRILKNFKNSSLFHNITTVHHHDVVSDLGNDAQIMGNKYNGSTEVLLGAGALIATPACIVTSKAVVGSSAINNLGLHANDMAIITLCRIPPDNSWG